MVERVFAPDQVENLAHNQMKGSFHPFTCPNRGDGNHRDAYGDTGALVATVRGWICPFCDYTQDWAHGFMKSHKSKPFTLSTFWTLDQSLAALGALSQPNEEGEGK